MKKGILATLFLTTSLVNTGFSCDELGTTGFVPENNMYIPVNAKSVSTITKMKFTQIIDKVESIYSPIVKNMGKTLLIERKWDDGTVNAYAKQNGKTYSVAMFGGLARHRAVTEDGFAVVVCHELGHHLGGLPKKARGGSLTWASNEGQADYFGTMKCLRKYMESDDNAKIVKNLTVPGIVTRYCQKQFDNEHDVTMCQRGAMAGMSLANLFKDLRRLSSPLKFETPDKAIVSKTNDNHPEPQCRLDTYFAGATCDEDHYNDVSNTDIHQGVCSRKFNSRVGVRPLCWFKPQRI